MADDPESLVDVGRFSAKIRETHALRLEEFSSASPVFSSNQGWHNCWHNRIVNSVIYLFIKYLQRQFESLSLRHFPSHQVLLGFKILLNIKRILSSLVRVHGISLP